MQTERSQQLRLRYSIVYLNLKGKTDADVNTCRYNCLGIFHLSTFYFLRYAQVKNQKGVKMFLYKYGKHKILPNFQEKVKIQWKITPEFYR